MDPAPATRVLEPILQTVRTTHPKADVAVIEKAYVVAEEAHRGQLRKSGDAYITHPLAVTTILAELGMTPATLAAALLHDTVEDTAYTMPQLRRDFGEEIAGLVDGVTKLDRLTYGEAAQAETVRKMIVAMARDIRVLVIKLADRLHNARTWRYVSKESAQRKAHETLEIYAPLAHRLGMNTIKWELEDLSFATLYPKVYDEIVRLVAERAPAREDYLSGVRTQVGDDLRSAKIKATVTGRPKHYYSVYQKMIVRGRDFEDIYDLVAVRVLVETVRDCYAALGALHARWNPVPGRFKDYIAMPKFNMYQSLHTTVIGPEGKAVEIQIRTHTMHRRAEYGVAAHWKYKEDTKNAPTLKRRRRRRDGVAAAAGRLAARDRGPERVPRLAAVRDERRRGLRLHAQGRGRRRCRPGSTPVDFAYAVHTEVGHHTIGGRVNGRLVPLESTLENGDVVEVLTSKADGGGAVARLAPVRQERAGAQQDPPVVLQGAARGGDRARQGGRRQGDAPAEAPAAAAHVGRGLAARRGRAALRRHRRPVRGGGGGPRLRGPRRATASCSRSAARRGPARTSPRPRVPDPHPRRRRAGDPGVVVVGARRHAGQAGQVLHAGPRRPDPRLRHPRQRRLGAPARLHQRRVPAAAEPERLVDVEWAPSASSVFLVQLQVEALDRNRLLSDVTRVLSDQHVNILSASVQTSRDRLALSRFTFEMGEPSHLDHVIAAVRRIEGVFDVYRITGGKTQHAPSTSSPHDVRHFASIRRRGPTLRSDTSRGPRLRESLPGRGVRGPLVLGGHPPQGLDELGRALDLEVGVEEPQVEREQVGRVGARFEPAPVVAEGLDPDRHRHPAAHVVRRGVDDDLRAVPPVRLLHAALDVGGDVGVRGK